VKSFSESMAESGLGWEVVSRGPSHFDRHTIYSHVSKSRPRASYTPQDRSTLTGGKLEQPCGGLTGAGGGSHMFQHHYPPFPSDTFGGNPPSPVVFLSILVLRSDWAARLAYNGDSNITIYVDTCHPEPRTNDFIPRSLRGKAAFGQRKMH